MQYSRCLLTSDAGNTDRMEASPLLNYDLQRHDLVGLRSNAWQTIIDEQAPTVQRILRQWQQANWPMVVRRDEAEGHDQQVAVGLALPPSSCASEGNKVRISALVHASAIVYCSKPKTLLQLLTQRPGFVPDHWQTALNMLLSDSEQMQLDLHCFGSFAYQLSTGQVYLHAKSDIDLLFYASSKTQLMRACELLARHAEMLPLDGEVIFPGGFGVAWKEWLRAVKLAQDHGGQRVLVKQRQRVGLVPIEELTHSLAA